MYKSAKFEFVLNVSCLQIYTLLTVTLLNNSVELSSNLNPEPLKEWIENFPSHPILIKLLSGSIGWGPGMQSSRLSQSKDSNPLKVLQKEYKVIYLMYQSAKFLFVLTVTYLEINTLLTVTLLNNSVELSSNFDPEILKRVD